MSNLPTTLEQYDAFFHQSDENKKILYDIYCFGQKEKQRYKDKGHRRWLRVKEENRKAREALPPEQRPKVGRPRKYIKVPINPTDTSPQE